MKNAQLWKRILRDGFHAEKGWDDNGVILRQVIKAPIIVDSREPTGELISTLDKSLVIPFPVCWIEHPNRECKHGCIVSILGDNRIGFITFMGHENLPVLMTGRLSVSLDNSGKIIGDSMRTEYPKRIADVTGEESCAREVYHSAALACTTMEMLGCKNISLSPRRQLDPWAVKEATQRNGGRATGYRYYVLVVRPPGSRKDSPGVEIGNMPHHVCRGHFAEYGPEFGKGLLFGKLAGRFYIPPHGKGDVKNGIVEKDYEVASIASATPDPVRR